MELICSLYDCEHLITIEFCITWVPIFVEICLKNDQNTISQNGFVFRYQCEIIVNVCIHQLYIFLWSKFCQSI